MTREERLQYCRICENRKMNAKIGLVCKLTDEHANFEDTCKDFIIDEEEKRRNLFVELAASGREDVGDSLDWKKNKTNGTLILFAGIFLTVLSHAIMDFSKVFILFYGAIIYGIRQYYKGVEQEKIMKKQQEFDDKIKEK